MSSTSTSNTTQDSFDFLTLQGQRASGVCNSLECFQVTLQHLEKKKYMKLLSCVSVNKDNTSYM